MEKKATNKKVIELLLVAVAIIALVSAIFITRKKSSQNIAEITDPEILRSISYGELADNDKKVEGCDYVEFSSFFTRDLDGDGYAEKVKGSCREISQTDTMYAELNVLTQGSLRDAKITVNGENFVWQTAIVEDKIVKGDYIGETSEIIFQPILNPGSQKLLWGTIKSKVGNNINNYTKVNSVTLTGKYYDEDGNFVCDINQTRNLTVDWHGETKTEVNKYYYSLAGYNSYENQVFDIAGVVKDDNIELFFRVATSETNQKILLQEQIIEVTIPQLNGFDAMEVFVAENNVQSVYENGKLTITKTAEVDSEGNVTKSIARSNLYNVTVKYPLEAYNQIEADSIVISIPVKGTTKGYNNQNNEFENPHISTAEGIITATYSKPSGNIWNIYASVGNNEKISGTNSYRYQVSKEVPTDIFNGNIYEDKTTTYPVKWEIVIGDYTAIDKIELKEGKKDSEQKSDEFLDSTNTYTSMQEFETTTGVYFTKAGETLGDDGWIKLYNVENGEEEASLLETFTKDNWDTYTKENPYVVNTKSIKVETSKPVKNTTFSVYQIKEMDDEKIADDFSEEEFERLSYVYTNLKGTIEAPEGITYENGETTSSIYRNSYAYYDAPYSVAKIEVNPNQTNNQKTEDVEFKITTISESSIEKKWINGAFIIALPESIIIASINSVQVSEDGVQIQSSDVYEENGRYFIKIYTKNEEEKTYTITVNTSIAGNPLNPTEVKDVKLYAFNENCDNYYNETQDIYDLDSDGNRNDNIGYGQTSMTLIAPSGLLTTEYVTDYDDENNVTIAPNIADIEKSDETRTANINVNITNGYSGTISDIVILGRIPFEGNKYVLNGGDLNSKFTANMTGAITVPNKLQEYAKVYYSTKENASKDLADAENGWKTAEEVTEWSQVKSYLIDLQDYTLAKEEKEVFKYEVNVPAGLGYNSASFSDHAVYYNLDTENGKLAVQTEPNKVGIQVVAKYSLQLTKNKKAHDNMYVQGATYSVTTKDVDGNDITKSATTNAEGVLTLRGLYVDREYTLKEISAPKDYAVSTDEIVFEGLFGSDGNLEFNVRQGKFKDNNAVEITTDEKQNYLVKVDIEDEAKYTLKINKTDEEGTPIKGVKFILKGREKVTNVYKTNDDGIVIIGGLCPEAEYELQEIKADGYYVDEESRKFTITRDNTGKLKVQTNDEKLANEIKDENIAEEDGITSAEVVANIVNEKIPTYNLQIIKVEENKNEDNVNNLKRLPGAKFILSSEYNQTIDEYITNENGVIEIDNLYPNVTGRSVTGNYSIQESRAPEGYANDAEKIEFCVEQDGTGNLSINIENEDTLSTYNQTIIDGRNVKIVISNEPLFKITKTDSEIGTLLPNAKFVIYEIDEVGMKIDNAKDVNGDYIGEPNDEYGYVVITNQNGEVSAALKPGLYRIDEVGYPEGYDETITSETIKIEGNKSKYPGKEIVEVNYIEDLVDISNNVKNGISYENKVIILKRSLNFYNSSSYRNISSMEYGDINENGVIESIQSELTNRNSGAIGFTPIGTGKYDENKEQNYFSGIFDGNNNSIDNLYVNPKAPAMYVNEDGYLKNVCAGLFGHTRDAEIKNIEVKGYICTQEAYNAYVGGIVGYASGTTIINCKNDANINVGKAANVYAGGISGYAGIIKGCSNYGSVVSTAPVIFNVEIGGISGYSKNITCCYNLGSVYASNNSTEINNYPLFSISNTEIHAGGIAGKQSASDYIRNCYNTGKIDATNASNLDRKTYAGGITGYSTKYSNGNCGKVINCYNTGSISSSNYAGGISAVELNTNDSTNIYYLQSCSISGSGIITQGNQLTSFEMMSDDFYNQLNVDGVWKKMNNAYPTLINYILAEPESVKEIEIKNNIKKFNITTDINEIDGVKGGTITGEDMEPYEVVKNHDSNTKWITMTPNNGYQIVQVTINNEPVAIETDSNGKFIIPANYFKDITEDKHIVVTYGSKNQVLTINKIDENTNEGLEGAEFSIKRIGQDSIEQDVTNSMSRNNYYYFQNYDGVYIADNGKVGVHNSEARSIIEIKNIENGEYYVQIAARISSEAGKDFGWATLRTDQPSTDNVAGRIFYISGEIGIKYYESAVVNVTSNRCYVTLGYKKNESVSAGEDALFINSILLCKKNNNGTVTKQNIINSMQQFSEYDFRLCNNSYIPTNSKSYTINKANTTANSLIYCSNLNSTRKYIVEIEAEISCEKDNDYGYATISFNSSSYSESGDNIVPIFKISGKEERKIYKSEIISNKSAFYVNLGYHKNGSIDGEEDLFKIYSVKLYGLIEQYTTKTTDDGLARVVVQPGLYEIKEIGAPDGYTLDSTPRTVEVGPGKENSITITNKHKTGLLVHHYFKDTTKEGNEQYTTLKVAEDEHQQGDIEQEYTTSPRFDLDNLYLEKSDDGKYVIPENDSGTFGDSLIEVNYYYELKPIELKINHYLEGTTTSLADEKTEKFNSEITFNEDDTYKITTEGSYKINTNEDYHNLLADKYELVRIESTVNPELNLEDTLIFNENAELTYYYKLKEHKITTEVKEHIESRTSDVSNEKEDTLVKGGHISGEDKSPYEIVSHENNSKNEIVATPDEGYRISKIILESGSGDSKVTTIIYDEENDGGEGSQEGEGGLESGEGSQQSEGTEPTSEIKYIKNSDGSITLKGLDETSNDLFKNVTEDKHIIVEFAPEMAKLVVHHYIEGTGEEFGTDLIRVLTTDGVTEHPDEVRYDFVDEPYATKASDQVNKRYKFVSSSTNTSGKYTDKTTHVYYYYNLDDFAYSIHYFYDGVEKEENIVQGDKVLFGSEITEYPDKPEGYIFSRVEPTDSTDERKAKLTIAENEEDNVINVYYVSYCEITTEVVEHEEKYSDGTTELVKGGTISGEGEAPYEKVQKLHDSKNNIVIKPDEDYEIAKVVIKDLESGEETELDIDSFKAEDGSITLNGENGYFKNMTSSKHIEVEFSKKTKVTVKYLSVNETDGNGNPLVLAEEVVIEGKQDDEYNTQRKVISKYVTAEKELTDGTKASETYENGDGTYTKYDQDAVHKMYADETTIIYWYEKAPRGKIIVRHIEIDEEDIKNGLTLDSGTELDVELYSMDDIISEAKANAGNGSSEGTAQGATGGETGTGESGSQGSESEESGIGEGGTQGNESGETGAGEDEPQGSESGETGTGESGQQSGNSGEGNNGEEGQSGESQGETNPSKPIEAEKIVNRKSYTDSKYNRAYINVAGPESTEENIKIVSKGDSNYKVIVKEEGTENETIEIRFYYERQYKITTKVIPHTEIINGVEESIKGGTITGDGQSAYELVNRMGANEKAITATPADKYRIKYLTINEKEINVARLKEGSSTANILAGYFKNMTEDKHIVAEYERIPARVTVKYLEEGTEKELAKEVEINGLIDDEYKTNPKEIEGYELITEKYPSNEAGNMTEEEIIVIYYYRKIPEKVDINDNEENNIEMENAQENISKGTGIPSTHSVKTGDNVIVYIAIFIITGSITVFAFIMKKKE